MRKRTIVSRGSFEGALTTARVIQQVVDATSTYLGTITLINVGLGALTALSFGGSGCLRRSCGAASSPSPTTFPTLGPIVCALLLFFGGLMTFPGRLDGTLPPSVFIGLHLVEATSSHRWWSAIA